MKKSVCRNPLPVAEHALTREHFVQMRGNKAVGFLRMKANDLLDLTTANYEHKIQIRSEAMPLGFYNGLNLQSALELPPLPGHSRARWKTTIPPMLKVQMGTGKVLAHEGRHRSAAVLNAVQEARMKGRRTSNPKAELWVAIVLADENRYARYYRLIDRPGEYRPDKVFLTKRDIPDVFENEDAYETKRVRISKSRFIPVWAREPVTKW